MLLPVKGCILRAVKISAGCDTREEKGSKDGIEQDPPSSQPSCCQEKGAEGIRFLWSLWLETPAFLSPSLNTRAEEKLIVS